MDPEVDIVELDRPSLLRWLREEEGRAEELVAELLAHGPSVKARKI